MPVIAKHSFAHAGPLTLSIVDSMLANGFKAIFPVTETPPHSFVRPTNLESFTVILEAQGEVDPLNADDIENKQPWRIAFTVYNNACMGIVVGSDGSLKDDGILPYTSRIGDDGKLYFGSPVGLIGSAYVQLNKYVVAPSSQWESCLEWVPNASRISCAVLPSEYRNIINRTDNPTCFTLNVAGSYTFVPDGFTTMNNNYRGMSTYENLCKLKVQGPQQIDAVDKNDIKPMYGVVNQGFINRAHRVWQGVGQQLEPTTTATYLPWPVYPGTEKDMGETYPMSYHLVLTDHGMFLAVWEGSMADASGEKFSWICVQRPVDRDTGETITTGKAPVFCVSSVGNEVRRFVVRESDRFDATPAISAVKDGPDYAAIINDKLQVGVSEDNTYVVNFPSRLNTPRYAYTYELDMIGYTSASVVANETDIPVKIYGEQDERIYYGMFANQANNNGMRIVALQSGGGI